MGITEWKCNHLTYLAAFQVLSLKFWLLKHFTYEGAFQYVGTLCSKKEKKKNCSQLPIISDKFRWVTRLRDFFELFLHLGDCLLAFFLWHLQRIGRLMQNIAHANWYCILKFAAWNLLGSFATLPFLNIVCTYVQCTSKIKLKNANKKRTVTVRRVYIFKAMTECTGCTMYGYMCICRNLFPPLNH
jgi:hypothetical protein